MFVSRSSHGDGKNVLLGTGPAQQTQLFTLYEIPPFWDY